MVSRGKYDFSNGEMQYGGVAETGRRSISSFNAPLVPHSGTSGVTISACA
jgi:hypothetical protein